MNENISFKELFEKVARENKLSPIIAKKLLDNIIEILKRYDEERDADEKRNH